MVDVLVARVRLEGELFALGVLPCLAFDSGVAVVDAELELLGPQEQACGVAICVQACVRRAMRECRAIEGSPYFIGQITELLFLGLRRVLEMADEAVCFLIHGDGSCIEEDLGELDDTGQVLLDQSAVEKTERGPTARTETCASWNRKPL